MRLSASLRGGALCVLLLGSGKNASAQGNEISAPTGGRSALMGNTGVALARDGSAPFLNPATIVRINDNSLAFSVNFYTFASTTFSGWHQPGPVDSTRFGNVALNGTSIGTNGFRIFPSTLCLFFTIRGVTAEGSDDGGLHRGRQKLAVCFGSSEFEDVVMPALSFNGTTPGGLTAQTQSIARNWNRFHAGPTYSVSLTDSLAVGLSVHGIYTNEAFVLDSTSITSTAGGAAAGAIASSLGVGGSAHSFDLAAILGAAYRVGQITFGASVQLPSLHIFGNYSGTLHSAYGVGGVDTATLTSGSGSYSAPPPMRFAVGVGAEWRRLAVELDGSFQLPMGGISSSVNGSTTNLMGGTASATSFSSAYAIQEHPVWNTALGAEVFVSKSFSVIGGASTNLSALPALSPTMSLGNLMQARTNMASASLGVGSYGGAADLLIGAQFGYGWGQSLAVNPYVVPNDWAVVDTRSYSVMLILAGATNLRAIGRAVEKVERAVTTGNPELSPAPGQAPVPARPTPTRELPKSGGADPRNLEDPDTGRPAPAKPSPGPPTDAGSPPSPQTESLPGPGLDPHNRTFPPK
jgi:hypothetical protein